MRSTAPATLHSSAARAATARFRARCARRAGSIWWSVANYYYAMRSADGSATLTYIEGDVVRGDQRPIGEGAGA